MNIGIDIEEVKRFSKYVKDEDYRKRVFSKDEIIYCMAKKNAGEHFAVRFAAKEAVWKALNGKNKKLLITDISIKNTKIGKPEVYIKNKLNKKIEVSLSHTSKYAAAVAIVF